MFPPFPQDLAKNESLSLIDFLDKQGQVDFGNNCGKMFGILVCLDRNNKQVVLKAFSGQYCGEWLVEGWVPPCFNVEAWKAEVERADPEIKRLTSEIEKLKQSSQITKEESLQLENLKQERKKLSQLSLKNIYNLYEFCCFDGHKETYQTLFKDKQEDFLPPTGTGDCCAPKLLNYAYKNKLKPISLAEFYYGLESNAKLKTHKQYYSPCDEKCQLLLPKMIGLDILYQDNDIIVVNKPSGVLSVPGKGEDKADCISTRVRNHVQNCIEQPSVHRLDMDTSGILVLGLTKESHRNLSIQFQDRKVEKQYVALLRGRLSESSGESAIDKETGKHKLEGIIEFPMRVDLDNRPYQIFDTEYGRMATTQWKYVEDFKIEKTSNKVLEQGLYENSKDSQWRTRVLFSPHTGRTHQLRLHSTHSKGLGLSIVGDRLYGTLYEGERLCLQAFHLVFTHPVTNEKMEFYVNPEF